MKLEAAIKSLTDSVKNKDFAYGPAVQSVLDALAALQEQLDYRNKVPTRAINQREAAEAELAALKAKLANPVVLRKVIDPDDVDSILDPTANTDEYERCVGADMWNAAMTFATKAIHASGFTVKGE